MASPMLNRRTLLAAGAGLTAAALTPGAVFAKTMPWSLAVNDVEADIQLRALRRIHGRAPAPLSGVLYRNGPAKWRRPGGNAGHWFDGDGMVRRFAIRDGQASLSARFADTLKRRDDTAAGAVVTPGFDTPMRAGSHVRGQDDANAANVSVLPIGGEIWALGEGDRPLRLDAATLETRGYHALSPDLGEQSFLAHPKLEPNGRLWNLGMKGGQAVIWRLGPDGQFEAAAPIALPRKSYIHDFTATDRRLVIVLQPWLQERHATPYMTSFVWRPEQGVQVLVIDKDDLTKQRLFELPAFFFFHLGDAWEDLDGTIRFDAAITDDVSFVTLSAVALLKSDAAPDLSPPPRMALITLSANGKADLYVLPITGEFPRTDARFAGSPRSRTIHVSGYDANRSQPTRIAVQNWRTGASDAFDFGPHQQAEEFVFSPRPGGGDELDGWLIGSTVNFQAGATELHVFDARHVADGPLCTWRADVALPVSFHGSFVVT